MVTDEFRAARLPPISATLVLEAVGLECFRDQFGMQQCNVRGIGARRRKLGKSVATDLKSLDEISKARDQARCLLSEMCRICKFKRCKMHDWNISAPPV